MIKYNAIFSQRWIINILPQIFFSVGTTARNGTCYSSTECTDKSGQAAGGCAAG